MAHNASHKARVVRVTPEHDWASFDALPAPVRRALSDAKFEWAATPLLTDLRKGRATASQAVAAIARWDREQAEQDLSRVWGVQPEVNAEDLW